MAADGESKRDHYGNSDDDIGLVFDEDAEKSWRIYLADFKTEVYPIFAPFGFTLPEAFNCWTMNALKNQIEGLLDQIE